MTSPNIGLTELANAQGQYLNANETFAIIDAILQTRAISKTLTAAPASPSNGDVYIMASAWAGITLFSGGACAAGDIAVYRSSVGSFKAIRPKEGWKMELAADDTTYRFDGAAWQVWSAGGGASNATQAASSSGGVLNLSATTAPVILVTLTENITSISLPAGVAGQSVERRIVFTQGGAGTYTIPTTTAAWGGIAVEDGLSIPAAATGVGSVSAYVLANDNNTGWRMFIDDSLRRGGTLSGALNEAPIVTLASAATVDIGAAAANTIIISGTTTITSLGTIASGTKRVLVFQGALTLTHNATSLILPSGANIVTAAGDCAEFVSIGSGNWKCTDYQRANGESISSRVLGPSVTYQAGNPTSSLVNTGLSLPDFSASGVAPPFEAGEVGRQTGAGLTLGGIQFLGVSTNNPAAVAMGFTGYLGSNSPTAPGLLLRSFKHNGTTGITTLASSEIVLQIANGGTGRLQCLGDGTWRPSGDNTQPLGGGSNRWSVVYAGTGAINTSDAREKTAVRPLSPAEISASKQLAQEIGGFKFLAAIRQKGYESREHIGMTVQRAIEIMESNGLDPFNYGFICYDEWGAQEAVVDEEGNVTSPAVTAGNRYGFRSDELLLFIAAGFETRLAALEGEL